MKNNKGISLTEVSVSIIILSLFVGIIGSLFYQIGLNTEMIKYNAIATHYAVKVAEDIDKLSYENVNNEFLNTTLIPSYNIEDQFSIGVDVRNYNENNTKEDLLKIVTIQVNYSFLNRNETYKIEKLKVMEL
ncbi:MAG: hypothetical protein J6M60_07715 [Clostridia bacterium]|nr:hypothetical protein [Clostridia bacterium]